MNKKLRLLLGCASLVVLSALVIYIYTGPTSNTVDPRNRNLPANRSTEKLGSGGQDVSRAKRKTNNSPNRATRGGWPILVEAAYRGDLDEVKELIEQGANVNIKGPNNWTALHQAAGNGHTEVMQFLIDAGAYIHAENKSRKNARDLAAERGYESIATSLYEQGVADDQTREFIRLAAYGTDVQLRNRVQEGHDPNRVDHKGRSALFYALVRDFDQRYSQKQFVLRPVIVKRLLDLGADPNLPDARGKTPTMIFLERGGWIKDIFDVLIEHGAKLDVVDNNNRSLLYVGNLDLAKRLIEMGLDVNQADMRGLTALHVHASMGNVAMIELLLQNGADPMAVTHEGERPVDMPLRALASRKPDSPGYQAWLRGKQLLTDAMPSADEKADLGSEHDDAVIPKVQTGD